MVHPYAGTNTRSSRYDDLYRYEYHADRCAAQIGFNGTSRLNRKRFHERLQCDDNSPGAIYASQAALEMGVGGLAILISIGVIIFIAGASYAWREKIVRWLQ